MSATVIPHLGHDFNIDWNPRPGREEMRTLNRCEFVITFVPLPVEGGMG